MSQSTPTQCKSEDLSCECVYMEQVKQRLDRANKAIDRVHRMESLVLDLQQDLSDKDRVIQCMQTQPDGTMGRMVDTATSTPSLSSFPDHAPQCLSRDNTAGNVVTDSRNARSDSNSLITELTANTASDFSSDQGRDECRRENEALKEEVRTLKAANKARDHEFSRQRKTMEQKLDNLEGQIQNSMERLAPNEREQIVERGAPRNTAKSSLSLKNKTKYEKSREFGNGQSRQSPRGLTGETDVSDSPTTSVMELEINLDELMRKYNQYNNYNTYQCYESPRDPRDPRRPRQPMVWGERSRTAIRSEHEAESICESLASHSVDHSLANTLESDEMHDLLKEKGEEDLLQKLDAEKQRLVRELQQELGNDVCPHPCGLTQETGNGNVQGHQQNMDLLEADFKTALEQLRDETDHKLEALHQREERVSGSWTPDEFGLKPIKAMSRRELENEVRRLRGDNAALKQQMRQLQITCFGELRALMKEYGVDNVDALKQELFADPDGADILKQNHGVTSVDDLILYLQNVQENGELKALKDKHSVDDDDALKQALLQDANALQYLLDKHSVDNVDDLLFTLHVAQDGELRALLDKYGVDTLDALKECLLQDQETLNALQKKHGIEDVDDLLRHLQKLQTKQNGEKLAKWMEELGILNVDDLIQRLREQHDALQQGRVDMNDPEGKLEHFMQKYGMLNVDELMSRFKAQQDAVDTLVRKYGKPKGPQKRGNARRHRVNCDLQALKEKYNAEDCQELKMSLLLRDPDTLESLQKKHGVGNVDELLSFLQNVQEKGEFKALCLQHHVNNVEDLKSALSGNRNVLSCLNRTHGVSNASNADPDDLIKFLQHQQENGTLQALMDHFDVEALEGLKRKLLQEPDVLDDLEQKYGCTNVDDVVRALLIEQDGELQTLWNEYNVNSIDELKSALLEGDPERLETLYELYQTRSIGDLMRALQEEQGSELAVLMKKYNAETVEDLKRALLRDPDSLDALEEKHKVFDVDDLALKLQIEQDGELKALLDTYACSSTNELKDALLADPHILQTLEQKHGVTSVDDLIAYLQNVQQNGELQALMEKHAAHNDDELKKTLSRDPISLLHLKQKHGSKQVDNLVLALHMAQDGELPALMDKYSVNNVQDLKMEMLMDPETLDFLKEKHGVETEDEVIAALQAGDPGARSNRAPSNVSELVDAFQPLDELMNLFGVSSLADLKHKISEQKNELDVLMKKLGCTSLDGMLDKLMKEGCVTALLEKGKTKQQRPNSELQALKERTKVESTEQLKRKLRKDPDMWKVLQKKHGVATVEDLLDFLQNVQDHGELQGLLNKNGKSSDVHTVDDLKNSLLFSQDPEVLNSLKRVHGVDNVDDLMRFLQDQQDHGTLQAVMHNYDASDVADLKKALLQDFDVMDDLQQKYGCHGDVDALVRALLVEQDGELQTLMNEYSCQTVDELKDALLADPERLEVLLKQYGCETVDELLKALHDEYQDKLMKKYGCASLEELVDKLMNECNAPDGVMNSVMDNAMKEFGFENADQVRKALEQVKHHEETLHKLRQRGVRFMSKAIYER